MSRICLQLSISSIGFVRGRRWENSCGARVVIFLVFCNLLFLFVGRLLKEGLDGAGLFTGGVILRFRGWLGGGLSGGDSTLGRGDITGKKASNPPS